MCVCVCIVCVICLGRQPSFWPLYSNAGGGLNPAQTSTISTGSWPCCRAFPSGTGCHPGNEESHDHRVSMKGSKGIMKFFYNFLIFPLPADSRLTSLYQLMPYVLHQEAASLFSKESKYLECVGYIVSVCPSQHSSGS